MNEYCMYFSGGSDGHDISCFSNVNEKCLIIALLGSRKFDMNSELNIKVKSND